MVKFMALYKQPADPVAFDKHFNEVHKPLCELVPNLLKMEVTKVTGTPRGPSEYYMFVSMYFADQQVMMDSLMSDAGKATAKDARAFAADIFTGLFAEVTDAQPAVV
jgi:uncharacterized protein (TIGR02118 family)